MIPMILKAAVRLTLIRPDGSGAHELLPDVKARGTMSWPPDSRFLVYGTATNSVGVFDFRRGVGGMISCPVDGTDASGLRWMRR